jgi:hypothetical protein
MQLAAAGVDPNERDICVRLSSIWEIMMKFSFSLPNPRAGLGAGQVDDMIELAQAAELSGFDACAATDQPLRSPGPTLWRGGNSKRAMVHAIRACEGWSPFEINEASAGARSTSSLTLANLAGKVSAFRELSAEAGPHRKLDVAFIRPSADWLASSQQAIEELTRIDRAGVTWLVFRLGGGSKEHTIERLHQLSEDITVAGLRSSVDGVL